MSNTNKLNSEEVVRLYKDELMSINAIAEKFDTYPKKIQRVLQKAGVPRRPASDAQKNAIKQGRHVIESRPHDEESKTKIAKSMRKVWQEMSDEERQERSETAKEYWHARDDLDEFMSKARSAIQSAAMHGSKLEIALKESLEREGYVVQHGVKYAIEDDSLHIDLLLANENIAIEVDGPSHFRPVWGEDKLEKTRQADLKKNGLILSNGMHVIRVQQQQNLSKAYILELEEQLLDTIKKVINTPPKLTVI